MSDDRLNKFEKQFGICSCCGGNITFIIYEDVLMRWICCEPFLGEKCENYGKGQCDMINCLLDNKNIKAKRLEFKEIIKKKFMEILEEKGQVIFDQSNEILNSITELYLEEKGNYMFQRLSDFKNTELFRIFKRGEGII